MYDYPPIGGYPVQVESRGNEFYATFSSSGEFDICARLRDSQGRIVNILPPDHVELTECDKNIKLTYDPALGMWHGWFNKSNGNPGTYIFKFEFGIGDLTYHRTVYLIG